MTTRWRSLCAGVCVFWLVGVAMLVDRTVDARQADVVEIYAERFRFTPSEVRATVGTPLEFRLRSEDTDHGFHIVDTEIDVRIPKRNRGVASMTFEPTEPGRYTFECSHVCGAGHSFMRGTIVVTE